jgi:hypothetical protein
MLKGTHHSQETIELLRQRPARKGWHHSEETKEKDRVAHLGNKSRSGMKSSEIHKKRISEARLRRIASGELIGWKHSVEAKKKIGLASVGNSYALGNKLSLEQRDKISDASARHVVDGVFALGGEYAGVKFQDGKEVLFAMWCDRNGLGWRYQPVIFKIKDGVRYIPDFMLLNSNEFVEIGDLSRDKRVKMDGFVEAGHTLYFLTDSIELTEKNKWKKNDGVFRRKE